MFDLPMAPTSPEDTDDSLECSICYNYSDDYQEYPEIEVIDKNGMWKFVLDAVVCSDCMEHHEDCKICKDLYKKSDLRNGICEYCEGE